MMLKDKCREGIIYEMFYANFCRMLMSLDEPFDFGLNTLLIGLYVRK